ncbi:MAG: cytochrome b/b6 domain-containing protein [Gallionellaceae bacterium]|nr:cytochrome b/b6 domain-containing protein [Gallionellaceae bacterium]
MQRILVWDWPTRIGHWVMAIAFLIAYVTGESEEWRLVHVWAGGTLAGVVVFRLIWGLIGSRHARFFSFIRSPRAARDYLLGLLHGNTEHHTGHNPAGGYAILALLVLGLATAATGWPVYQDIGGEWLGELHEGVVNAMLAVVLIHLAGVLVGSLAHRENLPRAMVTGYKLGRSEEAISGPAIWAVPLLLACALFSAWWLSL